MKKVLLLTILLGLLVFRTTGAWANFDELDKLKRGVVNVITCPSEIPKQVQENYKQTEMKTSKKLFGGIIKGTFLGIGRALSGVWDVLTFNVEMPKNYEPLVKPDYTYEVFAGKKEAQQ